MTALAASLAVVAWFFGGIPPLWMLFLFVVPMFFCAGALFGNLNAMAMQPMGHIAGSAAAVIGAGTTLISAAFGSLIGQSLEGTVLPMALSFALFSALSHACCLWAGGPSGGRLARRVDSAP